MQKANNLDDAAMGHFSNLKRLAYFSAVVETGSFTAAAERLGITKAVVSQQVARLEADFRTSLLTRSTRKVVPTDAGQAFYQRCALILKEAADAFDELAQGAEAPSGTLRLTAPLDYGIAAIVPAITAFCRRYPQCKVDASLSDQSLDLMDGQVELAIRVGWLTELHLQARQIGSFRQLLVASPAWKPQLASMEEPQQLAACPLWPIRRCAIRCTGAFRARLWSARTSACRRCCRSTPRWPCARRCAMAQACRCCPTMPSPMTCTAAGCCRFCPTGNCPRVASMPCFPPRAFAR